MRQYIRVICFYERYRVIIRLVGWKRAGKAAVADEDFRWPSLSINTPCSQLKQAAVRRGDSIYSRQAWVQDACETGQKSYEQAQCSSTQQTETRDGAEKGHWLWEYAPVVLLLAAGLFFLIILSVNRGAVVRSTAMPPTTAVIVPMAGGRSDVPVESGRFGARELGRSSEWRIRQCWVRHSSPGRAVRSIGCRPGPTQAL